MSKDMGNALLALAERCEAATGLRDDIAMHELQHEIATAMHEQGWHPADCLRQFAFSIDAALTLVPEAHEWSVNWCGNSVAEVSELPDGGSIRGRATTPALALCAAALRARASVEGGVK